MSTISEESSDVVIGVDVGTTSVRCGVYDLKGHLRSTSSVSVIVRELHIMCKSEFQLGLQSMCFCLGAIRLASGYIYCD